MDTKRDKKIKDYINNNNYLHNISLILTITNKLVKLLSDISKKLKNVDFSKENTNLLETREMFIILNHHNSTRNSKVKFNLSSFILRMYILRMYNKKYESEISHFILKLEYLRKIYLQKNIQEMLAKKNIVFII